MQVNAKPISNDCRQNKNTCCAKHSRFHQMRRQAARRGKLVPSFEKLEKLCAELIDFRCRGCEKTMIWTSRNGGKKGDSVSLQHNRNGSMSLICHACNSKLTDGFSESGFYQKLKLKKCGLCEVVLPLDAFYRRYANEPDKVQSRCKPCKNQEIYANAKLKTRRGRSFASPLTVLSRVQRQAVGPC